MNFPLQPRGQVQLQVNFLLLDQVVRLEQPPRVMVQTQDTTTVLLGSGWGMLGHWVFIRVTGCWSSLLEEWRQPYSETRIVVHGCALAGAAQ